ncbi:hypothetical protein PO909_014730 [Leuciscus waleckii]
MLPLLIELLKALEDRCLQSDRRASKYPTLTPENTNNHRYHHPQTKDFDQMNSGAGGTRTVPLALVSICVFGLLSG